MLPAALLCMFCLEPIDAVILVAGRFVCLLKSTVYDGMCVGNEQRGQQESDVRVNISGRNI